MPGGDGGAERWLAEGQPTTDEVLPYPTGDFVAETPVGYFADREEVLGAIDEASACIVNALKAEQHRGNGGATYGRAGHIPSSVSVPAIELVDAATHAYLPAESMAEALQATGGDGRVITYCGAGIAASSVAFALSLLGREDVASYDASLQEWAADPALSLETS